MAAGKQKKSGSPKVFDVSRPGRTPADASARPVINNRKTVEDPDVSTKKTLMDPKQKITVKPSDDSAESKSSEPQTSSQKKDQKTPGAPDLPASEKSEDKVVVKTQSGEPKQHEPEKPQAATKQPEPESEPQQAQTVSDQQKEEEAESIGKAVLDDSLGSSAEQPAPKQQSASSGKSEPLHMGMPQEYSSGEAVVSQHHKHRTLWLEILSVLIILLLLAAIANLLLDAGIINTGLDIPHTDFFKDN